MPWSSEKGAPDSSPKERRRLGGPCLTSNLFSASIYSSLQPFQVAQDQRLDEGGDGGSQWVGGCLRAAVKPINSSYMDSDKTLLGFFSPWRT